MGGRYNDGDHDVNDDGGVYDENDVNDSGDVDDDDDVNHNQHDGSLLPW